MSNALLNKDAFEASEMLYLNSELADVHFIFNTDGDVQKVPAHKLILAVLSPVFKRMFFGALKETGDVEIVDADIDEFTEFLQFFYLSKVTLTMENMKVVVQMADKYNISEYVFDVCATLLGQELALENLCWTYQLAVYLDHIELMKHCENKIICSPKEIFESETFKRIDKEILEHILNFHFDCNESEILFGCLFWAASACKKAGLDEGKGENLKIELGDSLKAIRFIEMDTAKFTKFAVLLVGLFTAEEFKDIVSMQLVSEYTPKIFNRYKRLYPWNENLVLKCQRKPKTIENQIFKRRDPEVLSFTSNSVILLKTVYTQCVTFTSNVIITIAEVGSFESNDSPKILYRDSLEAIEDKPLDILLYKPLLIKPNILYEIGLHIEKNFVTTVVNPQTWEPTVELENGLKIEFHSNPSLKFHSNPSD